MECFKGGEHLSRDLISVKVSGDEIASFPSKRGRGVVTFFRRARAVELRDSLAQELAGKNGKTLQQINTTCLRIRLLLLLRKLL